MSTKIVIRRTGEGGPRGGVCKERFMQQEVLGEGAREAIGIYRKQLGNVVII